METCSCCGYKTIEEGGNYEICSICFWEDESIQSADPWYEGGANNPSLYEAQLNFKKYGAMEKRFITNIRTPTDNDVKDSDWRELVEEDKNYCTTLVEIEKVWGTNNAVSYDYCKRNAIG